MLWMLDTSVAIPLRESHGPTLDRIIKLDGDVVLSAISRVELENGVYRDAKLAPMRRALLDVMLESIVVLPFDDQDAQTYGTILAGLGWSRSRIIDRMIAAHAMRVDATLVTLNGKDFRDIEGLKVESWA